MRQHTHTQGFTLIELSIVLVIIGLIVGGILVGQSLISAAGVRATISQIEKYNTAANTFREKYGYLPEDIPAGPAVQFGFIARGTGPGQGDGNGLIEGGGGSNYGGIGGGSGEQLVFWVDLSTAGLISGGFSAANFSSNPPSNSSSVISQYLPQAQLGGGTYIYVFSGGWGDNSGGGNSNGINYFGLSAVSKFGIAGSCTSCLWSNSGLTVAQAAAIDTKIDDGMPLTGNVLGAYISATDWLWPDVGANQGPPTTYTVGPSTSTCFDNGGNNSNTMHYSVEFSNGANVTCGLTFKMQAGD
jgi:prepilin-type N-terminal cleavage/methylation domain-containing protein